MKQTSFASTPKFSIALLAPKYWGVWVGFGLLALLVNLLPFQILKYIGEQLGLLSMKVIKQRVHVAQRNFQLAFPDKSQQEIDHLTQENFKNTGMGLVETGIAWFWPTWRLKRRLVKHDMSILEAYEASNKGVLLCCVHALNLEITARAFAIFGLPGYGVFRPHKNPAYNFIQVWGRTHNGNRLVNRKDLKLMVRVLRQGHRLFYLPDHDYGARKSVFAPLFAVDHACTTIGTSMIASTSRCALVIGSGYRNEQGHYDILADQDISDGFPSKDPQDAAIYINQFVEQLILRAPTQWMWLHKRFKTLPDAEQNGSRYS